MLKFEVSRDIPLTRITSEKEFKRILDLIGIAVVEVQDNELICAAKLASTINILLLFASYTPSGNLSLTLKSDIKLDIDYAIESIIRYSSML